MQLIQTEDISFYYIDKSEDLPDLIQELQSQTQVALDTETYPLRDRYGDRASALDPHTSTIRLLQINWLNKPTPYVVDVMQTGVENLEPLIEQLQREDLEKIFHNAQFDLKQIRSTFDFWMPNTKCSLVALRRLGVCTGFKAAQTRGHSLKAMARDYFDLQMDKTEQDSDWSKPELDLEQLAYAALDVGGESKGNSCCLVLEAWQMLKQVLETEPSYGYGVKPAHDLDQQVMVSLAKMEYTGMPVNVDLLTKLQETAKANLEQCQFQVCKDLNLPVEQKVTMTAQGPQLQTTVPKKTATLLNNPKALVDAVNERLQDQLGYQLTDVQSSSLEQALNSLHSSVISNQSKFNIELVDNLLEYKLYHKMTGTDYLELVNPVTGCLHSSYNCLGASTSRMSSGSGKGSFNAQQLSKKYVVVEVEEPFTSQSVIRV